MNLTTILNHCANIGKYHLWNFLNSRSPTYFNSFVNRNPTVKQYNIKDNFKQEKNTYIPFALNNYL